MRVADVTDPTDVAGAREVTHPPQPPRRGGARATSWWGRAWVRAVEESSYDEADLAAARRLARGGHLGAITIGRGSARASVDDRSQLVTAALELPVLDDDQRATLLEVVGAEAGRLPALLAGELPHDLVEHGEEAGVELLPYGSELAATCTCTALVDPCRHALALGYQLARLLDVDPLVLLHLRGLAYVDLARALAVRPEAVGPTSDDPVLDVAVEAALRAHDLLERLDDA